MPQPGSKRVTFADGAQPGFGQDMMTGDYSSQNYNPMPKDIGMG